MNTIKVPQKMPYKPKLSSTTATRNKTPNEKSFYFRLRQASLNCLKYPKLHPFSQARKKHP